MFDNSRYKLIRLARILVPLSVILTRFPNAYNSDGANVAHDMQRYTLAGLIRCTGQTKTINKIGQ